MGMVFANLCYLRGPYLMKLYIYIWVWTCPLNLFILQVAVEMIERQCLFQGCSVWAANI